MAAVMAEELQKHLKASKDLKSRNTNQVVLWNVFGVSANDYFNVTSHPTSNSAIMSRLLPNQKSIMASGATPDGWLQLGQTVRSAGFFGKYLVIGIGPQVSGWAGTHSIFAAHLESQRSSAKAVVRAKYNKNAMTSNLQDVQL